MPDYFRTALLLEEKAAKLPRREPHRAYLLAIAIAKAARQIGIERLAGQDRPHPPGSLAKRAEIYAAMLT